MSQTKGQKLAKNRDRLPNILPYLNLNVGKYLSKLCLKNVAYWTVRHVYITNKQYNISPQTLFCNFLGCDREPTLSAPTSLGAQPSHSAGKIFL